MKIHSVAGFATITRDKDASAALYRDTMGLSFKQQQDYLYAEDLPGIYHFGVWNLRDAALICYGQEQWPANVPVPNATIEFELGSIAEVEEAVDEMKAQGQAFVHEAKLEPWGQTLARFISPEGLLVGLSYAPWHHPQPESDDELVFEAVAPSSIPMDILLEADPSEQQIAGYSEGGMGFVVRKDAEILAGAIAKGSGEGCAEIFNIAVLPDHQQKGIGSRLLEYMMGQLKDAGFQRVELGTGTFGHQLGFYQKHGFRVDRIDRDFFLHHYDEPIFENGIQHRDMLRLVCLFD